jgi:hypothetical protein
MRITIYYITGTPFLRHIQAGYKLQGADPRIGYGAAAIVVEFAAVKRSIVPHLASCMDT